MTDGEKIKRNVLYECLKCNYKWFRRKINPKQCPRCRNIRWFEPRLLGEYKHEGNTASDIIINQEEIVEQPTEVVEQQNKIVEQPVEPAKTPIKINIPKPK